MRVDGTKAPLKKATEEVRARQKTDEKAQFTGVKTPHILCFALSAQLKRFKFFPEEFMSILRRF